MVDLLWFVLTLILLAAETVVLVLLLVLRWKTPRTDTRETRTEYLQPLPEQQLRLPSSFQLHFLRSTHRRSP